MTKYILVAFNDSVSSRAVVDFLANLSVCTDDFYITLLHIFRKPSASEELMGKRFTKEEQIRLRGVLEGAKGRLVEKGFNPSNIEIEMVLDPYPTLADGIIEQCKKRNVDMVVIGRKRMSKAEEFVMGDVGVKLVRALPREAVLVVKSE